MDIGDFNKTKYNDLNAKHLYINRYKFISNLTLLLNESFVVVVVVVYSSPETMKTSAFAIFTKNYTDFKFVYVQLIYYDKDSF